MAIDRDKARGENIFPSRPCRLNKGRKVRAMISSPKMLGFLTSAMAWKNIDSCFNPVSARYRWTFST